MKNTVSLTKFPAKFTHREHNGRFVLGMMRRYNLQQISKKRIKRFQATHFPGVRVQRTPYQLAWEVSIRKVSAEVLYLNHTVQSVTTTRKDGSSLLSRRAGGKNVRVCQPEGNVSRGTPLLVCPRATISYLEHELTRYDRHIRFTYRVMYQQQCSIALSHSSRPK
jgi:hypothetical protein